jgi:hypothetical protein
MTVLTPALAVSKSSVTPLKAAPVGYFGSASVDPPASSDSSPTDSVDTAGSARDTFSAQDAPESSPQTSSEVAKKDHGLFQPFVDLVDGVIQVFHDIVTTILEPLKRFNHFLQYASERLNPYRWFKPETFHGQDERNQLTGAHSPSQAAKELTPLTVGLSLETLPAYQQLTAPVDKGLRRVLSLANQGSPKSAPNAPSAVMGLVGEQECTKTRFAQALADIAYGGPSALTTLDLKKAVSFDEVKAKLNLSYDKSPAQVVLIQHADLQGNSTMSEADKEHTLKLLTHLCESRPTTETSDRLKEQDINLHNTLLLLSLDAHPLEAPNINRLEGSPYRQTGPASVKSQQTMLLDKVRLEAPYWQAFTASSGFAPLVDAQKVQNTVS